MSFDHQEADLAKLKEYMLSAGHRQKVQAAANALRTALTNIMTVQGKIESLGKVPDDQVDHVKATIVGYTEFQDLVGMVAGLDQTSQIVERVQRKLLATPLMPTKARNAVKNPFPAAAASSAIPVDEYATDDEEAEAQDPSGTFLKRMSRDGVSQVEAAAALADIQRMQPMNAQGGCGGGYDYPGSVQMVYPPAASIPVPPPYWAGGGGDGNPGPSSPAILADLKPVVPIVAPVVVAAPQDLSGGGGGGYGSDHDDFRKRMEYNTSRLSGSDNSRVKKQGRHQVKTEPNAAKVARVGTEYAAANGFSDSVDLTSD